MDSHLLFRVPALFLCAGSLLITLAGCSSSHSLQIDAPQPVYFGSAPGSALPLDTAHVQFVRPIVVETVHTAEKEKVVEGTSSTITKEGSETMVGDASARVQEAIGNDSLRFIGNGEIRARVEVSVPWTSFFTEFLGAVLFGSTTSEGLGEASGETIGIAGTVYSVRRNDR
jgi:hypothetical protein